MTRSSGPWHFVVERHYLLNRSETIDSVTSQLDTSAIYCFDSFDIHTIIGDTQLINFPSFPLGYE